MYRVPTRANYRQDTGDSLSRLACGRHNVLDYPLHRNFVPRNRFNSACPAAVAFPVLHG